LLHEDSGGFLDWLGWARKKPVEEIKGDVKEAIHPFNPEDFFCNEFIEANSELRDLQRKCFRNRH